MFNSKKDVFDEKTVYLNHTHSILIS